MQSPPAGTIARAAQAIRPASGGRLWAFRLVVLLLAALLSLACAEWAVRLAMPQFDPSGHLRLEPRNGVLLGPPNGVLRHRKNTGDYDLQVRFGPRGFRDARDVASAGPDDLLAVGDSFTFGWGVQEHERFADLVQARLGRRVFNLGVPGAGLGGYRRALEYAQALGARSRELLLGLHVETDLHRCRGVQARRPKARAASHGRMRAIKASLTRHLALYGLATAAFHRNPTLRALATRLGWIVPNLAGVTPPSTAACSPEEIAVQVAALVAGHVATVLVIPSRGLWLPELREAEERTHRALVQALEARGLAVVDPRAAFEATGAPLSHHFAHDGHWNARGHRVAADLLARAMSR